MIKDDLKVAMAQTKILSGRESASDHPRMNVVVKTLDNESVVEWSKKQKNNISKPEKQ